jgi:hypothetical protein
MSFSRLSKLDLNYVWVFLLCVPAVAPLFQAGFLDSHDGLFHLYRLAAVDRAFKAGIFYPRWFPDFAFGYGQPVLNYYGPLTYFIAQGIHMLGPGYILSMKLTLALGMVGSALGMYLYAKEIVGRYPALVAAAVYAYFPYHLADTYLRGALAEAWAFVFMPLCLWAVHRILTKGRSLDVILLALSYAGLIVTHNLTALIFTPVLLGYMLLLWCLTRRARATLWALLSLGIAVGLCAFYWLPVLMETQYVGLAANLGSAGYERHLAPFPDFVSLSPVFRYLPDLGGGYNNPFYPLGLTYAVVIVASAAVLVWLLRTRGAKGSQQMKGELTTAVWHQALFLAVTLASIFMMLSCSLPLWRLTQPVLASLQYPWRFMSLASVGLAMLAGFIFLPVERGAATFTRHPMLWHTLGVGLMLTLMIYGLVDLPASPLPLEEDQVTVRRMWEEDLAARQIGATWTAEYVPIWVQADRSVVGLPPPDLVPSSPRDLSPGEISHVTLVQEGLLSMQMQVESEQRFPLRLHAFYFKGWKAHVDGEEAAVYPSGDLGLVTVDVPAGEHLVVVRFEDTTPRLMGNFISLLAALGLAGFSIFNWRGKAIMALAITAILVGTLVAWHIRPFTFSTTPEQKEANLEDQAMLLGYSLDGDSYRPGDTMHVTLYWLALQEMSENYKVFVHFMDEDSTTMWAQHDGDPVEGFTPTTRWMAGEILADHHALYIPPEAPPATYKLFTGMYEFDTMRNLTILTPQASSPHNRILLRQMEVVSP